MAKAGSPIEMKVVYSVYLLKMFNITKYSKYNLNLSGTSCISNQQKIFLKQSLLRGIREMHLLITPVNINWHSHGRTVWYFVSRSFQMLCFDCFYTHEVIKESYTHFTNLLFPAFFIITKNKGMVNYRTHTSWNMLDGS